MTDRDLIRRIERSAGQRAGYKQLVRELGLGGGRDRRLLVEQLARLTARGQLIRLDRDHWTHSARAAQPTRDNLAAGRLDLHRDGYGFVRPEVQAGRAAPRRHLHPAQRDQRRHAGRPGARRMLPPRSDGRQLGRIVRVLTRRNPTVVGIFHYSAQTQRFPEGNYVTPFDERMTQPILIPDGMEIPPAPAKANPHRVLGEEAPRAENLDLDNLEGLVVDVEITDCPTPTRPARGRVIEMLGDPDAFGVDVEMMIRKHHLPHVFPDNVLAEARDVAHLDQEDVAERRDFRDLPIVTIDGETASDFDDAVLVTANCRQWRIELQVHIADVAQYVSPAPISISKRACAATPSTSPTAPCPCCRRSCRPTSAACARTKTGSSLAASCRSTRTAKCSATRSAKASSAPHAA